MVEQAQRPCIGAVGGLLLYPDDTIQHAGVVGGIGGVAGHSHKYFPATAGGYFGQIHTINNYSALTAACLMCRRQVFEAVGGFEEELTVAFNDVDFCFKIVEQGYRNIYLPHDCHRTTYELLCSSWLCRSGKSRFGEILPQLRLEVVAEGALSPVAVVGTGGVWPHVSGAR